MIMQTISLIIFVISACMAAINIDRIIQSKRLQKEQISHDKDWKEFSSKFRSYQPEPPIPNINWCPDCYRKFYEAR